MEEKNSPQLDLTDAELRKVEIFSRAKNTSVLAIFFDDIKGSRKLSDEMTDGVYLDMVSLDHDEPLRRIVTRDGAGEVIKSTGDGSLVVFTEPSTAVERAVEFQQLLRGHAKLKVRIGIGGGQVRVETEGGTKRDVFGDHVSQAARAMGLAEVGHILATRFVHENAIRWIKPGTVQWKNQGTHTVKNGEPPIELFEPFVGDPMSAPVTGAPADAATAFLLGFLHGEFGTYHVYFTDEFDAGIDKKLSQSYFQSHREEAWRKLEALMRRLKLDVSRSVIEEDRTNPLIVMEDKQKRLYLALSRRSGDSETRAFLFGELLGGEFLWCEGMSRGMSGEPFQQLWEMKLEQLQKFGIVLGVSEETELLEIVQRMASQGGNDRLLLETERTIRGRLVGRYEEIIGIGEPTAAHTLRKSVSDDTSSTQKRYDAFCADAEELLQRAGLSSPDQTPKIVGNAFYQACVSLAAIHFPDDKEVGGSGPRGLIWSMYPAVQASSRNKKDPDPVAGAQAVALTVKNVIKLRPPLQK